MPRKPVAVSVGSPRRRRTEVDPEAAAQFEARAEGASKPKKFPERSLPEKRPAQADAPSAPNGPSAANRKGTLESPYVRKRDGVATVTLTFTVPVELAKRVKVHAALTGTSSSRIGVAALEGYLADNSKE